jgi:hypothetical protein
MFGAARLELLQQRKQELLRTLDEERRRITSECAVVRERLAWVEKVARVADQISPFLGVAAPLIGFLLARRASASGSGLQRLASVLPLATRLLAAIRQLRQG